jgi:dTDP-glucose 4,6-dehydratase
MTIAEAANSSCPIYNVGSERSIEMRSLAGLVAKYFNVGISMNPIEDQKIDKYVPSTEKARNELGLVNSVDLEEALDKTVWKIKNTNIY